MKICKKCLISEPLVSFYPTRRVCKTCHAFQGYLWKEQNKEQWLGIVKKSKTRAYVINRETILERNKNWRILNPEKYKECSINSRKKFPGTIKLHRKLRSHAIKVQTPSWIDKEKINSIYKEAKKLGLQVDHIVPLQGKTVCGLHVETNLQLLTKIENLKKGNKHT